MRRTYIGVLLLGLSQASAEASTIMQKVGSYTDSQGLSLERVNYDLTLNGHPTFQNLSSSAVDLNVIHDQYQHTQMQNAAYDKSVYASGYHANDQGTALVTQTWDRLTETRELGAYQTDGHVSARTGGAGVSQWYHEESVRLSIDLSRTLLEQPLYQVLDTDFQVIGNPTIGSASTATAALRHLATPTTIVDYTVQHTVTDNRPDSNSFAVAIRQFLPPLDGAVHADATRALNRGYVTTATTYGQVDAWIGDLAYLQNLWRGARARFGYRYYREQEITRAYGDEKQMGSDTFQVSLGQDVPKRAIDAIGVPLTVDLQGSRYLTNVQIAATTYEVGVTAKF